MTRFPIPLLHGPLWSGFSGVLTDREQTLRRLYLPLMLASGAAAWVLVLLVLQQPPLVRTASVTAGVLWSALTLGLWAWPPLVRAAGAGMVVIVGFLYGFSLFVALFLDRWEVGVRDVVLTAPVVYVFAFLVLSRRMGALASASFGLAVLAMTVAFLLGGPVSGKMRDVQLLLMLCIMSVIYTGGLSAFAALVERDASERARLEALAAAALTDALTGLPNRRMFDERLQAAVRAGRPFAVMFIDLNRFKVVNDRYGHHVGDLLLCEVARRLQAAARTADDPGIVVARVSGDEFAVLVPGEAGDPEVRALVLAGCIRDALAPPAHLAGISVSVGASVGVSAFPRDGLTADELLIRADSAMYAQKLTGRDGVGRA